MLEQPAFGHRLRELRLSQGLSQAALVGDEMSTGYLSRLESGARRPTPRVVEHLAKRLGIPVSEFAAPTETQPAAGHASQATQVLAAMVSGADDSLAEILADALRNGESWDPALRWQGLWLLAGARVRQGRHDDQRDILVKLVEISDQLGNPTLRVRSRTQLSRSARVLGDNVAARGHAAEAYEIAAGLPLADRAAALTALISAEAELGQLAEARVHADELCEITEPAGGTQAVEAQWAAATVRIRQGDYAGARALLERALAALDAGENLTMWIRLRLAAASLYLQVTPAPTDRARELLDEVAPVVQMVGTELHRTQLLTLRAHLAFAEGRLDDARTICAQVGPEPQLSFRDGIRFKALCGQLRIAEGDREAGIRILQDLARQSDEAHNAELAAEVWRLLAETLVAGPNGSPARTAARQPHPRRRTR